MVVLGGGAVSHERGTPVGMDDDTLLSLLASTAPRSILLLEDLDATPSPAAPPPTPGSCSHSNGSNAFNALNSGGGGDGERGAGGYEASYGRNNPAGGLTLAGLLNAIDGVAAQVRPYPR